MKTKRCDQLAPGNIIHYISGNYKYFCIIKITVSTFGLLFFLLDEKGKTFQTFRLPTDKYGIL